MIGYWNGLMRILDHDWTASSVSEMLLVAILILNRL